MTISLNGGSNPFAVIYNGTSLDKVVYDNNGTLIVVWRRVDIDAPTTISQIRFSGDTSNIYLNNLTLVDKVIETFITEISFGYVEKAIYSAASCSFDLKWSQYSIDSSGYPNAEGAASKNKSLSLYGNFTGTLSKTATASGVPSQLDYDFIDITPSATVNIDFKADIVTGHNGANYSPSTFPTISANAVIKQRYRKSSNAMSFSWEQVGNWSSQTAWAYTADDRVYAYLAYGGVIFSNSSTVVFEKYHYGSFPS